MNTVIPLILMLCGCDVPRIDEHAVAIMGAAKTHKLDVELIVAVAWEETKFQPLKVSRSKNHCGVMQVRVTERASCAELQTVETGYLEGAYWLHWWLGQAKGDMGAALRGYGCGYQTELVGDERVIVKPVRPADWCRGYDGRVQRSATRLRRLSTT